MRIIYHERTPSRVLDILSQTPVRLRRHGNTTFAPLLLSQNLLSGEGNSQGGDGELSFALVPTNVHILLNATKNNFEQCIRGGEEREVEEEIKLRIGNFRSFRSFISFDAKNREFYVSPRRE